MGGLAKVWGQFIIWILLYPPVSRQNRVGERGAPCGRFAENFGDGTARRESLFRIEEFEIGPALEPGERLG